MLLKKIITKSAVTCYDLLPVHCRVDSKKILLIFAGVIGDSVLFCDALEGYKELYPAKEGYEITIYTTIPAAIILKRYTTNFDIVAIDFRRLNTDFRYHLEVMRKLQSVSYHVAIDPFPAFSMESTSLLLKAVAKNKIQAREEGFCGANLLERYVLSRIKNVVFVSDDFMELQKNAYFLRKIGLDSFKAHIPKLLMENTEIQEKNECVFALGASTPCKRWEAKRFAEVANYLIKKYNFKVVLCGGSGEERLADQFFQYVDNKEAVINMIGKTLLPELVDIIANARLLIGNDSSSVHIAAAVRTPSVCIVGGWNYGRMYPYKVDELFDSDVLPVHVDKTMQCFNCAKHVIGFGNTVCQEKQKMSQMYPCIENICAQDVINVVKKILIDYE